MTELFDEEWAGKSEVVDDDVMAMTLSVSTICELFLVNADFVQITLFVISSAGFGMPISWKRGAERPAGYEMNFKVRVLN